MGLAVALLLLTCHAAALHNPQPAPRFGGYSASSMVLAASDSPGSAAKVCGEGAPPLALVEVSISVELGTGVYAATVTDHNATGRADAQGDWCVVLTQAPPASKDTYTLQASVASAVPTESKPEGSTLSDVLFGDLWLCSGQVTGLRPFPSTHPLPGILHALARAGTQWQWHASAPADRIWAHPQSRRACVQSPTWTWPSARLSTRARRWPSWVVTAISA